MSESARSHRVPTGPGEPIRSVLSTVPFTPAELEQLREAVAPASFHHVASDDADGIAEALTRVDVAVLEGDLDERFVRAPHLRWVHCDHSGLTRSALPEVFERGLLVTGSAGRSAQALAQHGFYFALTLTYEAKALFAMQDARTWRGIPGYIDKLGLWGKTLGIVGFGHTGREMAKLGRAFGMRVVVHRRRDEPAPEYVDRMLSSDRGETVDALVDEADVIMLATQLTDETYHLFSRERLARMRPSAFLINLARGPVIDEDALAQALRDGVIAGAGLDVFRTEPLPETSPLWGLDNVVITPHMTPRLPDKTQRSIDMITENVRRYRAGEPMLNALTDRDTFTHEWPRA